MLTQQQYLQDLIMGGDVLTCGFFMLLEYLSTFLAFSPSSSCHGDLPMDGAATTGSAAQKEVHLSKNELPWTRATSLDPTACHGMSASCC